MNSNTYEIVEKLNEGTEGQSVFLVITRAHLTKEQE